MKRETVVTVYIGTLATLAAGTLGWSLAAQQWNAVDPAMLMLLALVAAATQRLPIFLFRSSAISVSFAATIAAYVLYGTGAGLLTQLVCAAVNAVTPPKPARKVLFNTASLVLSGFLASTAYQMAGGSVPPTDLLQTLSAVAVSGAVYFVATTSFTAAVISLTSRVASTAITHPVGATVSPTASTTFLAVWRENYGWMLVNFLATSVNGASLAIAYQALGFFGAVTFVLPLGVAWYSFRLYVERSLEVRRRNDELQALNERLRTANESLERSTLSVIESLVSALEAKGEEAHGHSAATTAWAAETARRMGLPEEDIAAIHIGALIHDVGKIGVAPEILRKPAALTVDEWDQIRQHPILGAQILAQVPALESARPIVLAHHERYDGTGYPRGLRGTEIPIAAQIVSVADAFDAMISPRPYRPALTVESATRELRAGSGTQFNPAVVEAFLATIAATSDAQAPAPSRARSAPLPAR